MPEPFPSLFFCSIIQVANLPCSAVWPEVAVSVEDGTGEWIWGVDLGVLWQTCTQILRENIIPFPIPFWYLILLGARLVIG